MTTWGRIIYAVGLGAAALLTLAALLLGWWIYALVAVVCGALFAYAAPFVLGRRWRPPAPRPTRRPVKRRRR